LKIIPYIPAKLKFNPPLPDAIQSENSDAYSEMADLDILRIYRSDPDSNRGARMARELLRRHRNLLRKLAWRMSKSYPNSNDFDDHMQHACVGAMIAYGRYDFSKVDCKLSYYVHFSVQHYLLDMINHDSFIQCPSHKRAMRSYLSGRYDDMPEKKAAFEKKHNLHNESLVADARTKYKGLTPEMWSLDVEIEGHKHRGSSEFAREYLKDTIVDAKTSRMEENLILRADVSRAIEQLSDRQKQVCKLAMHYEHTNAETARILSEEMQQTVTEGMVRSDIRAIRNVLAAVL
jgi:RNA polymerase sigma factor (sigma-70 family)